MFLCSYYDENILHHIHKVDDTRRSWHFYHLSLCGDSLSLVSKLSISNKGVKSSICLPKFFYRAAPKEESTIFTLFRSLCNFPPIIFGHNEIFYGFNMWFFSLLLSILVRLCQGKKKGGGSKIDYLLHFKKEKQQQ